ncbi:MAG: AAA family ATPase [candidate division WOR-3 bacterium]
MILKSIKIENFIVYDSENINFEEGLNIITGENGSGKSSIVQAIYYGLFGKSLYYRNVESFARNKAKSFQVELELEEKGKSRLEIRRSRNSFWTNRYGLRSSTDLKNYLLENYNINEWKYKNTLLIEQGQINSLIMKTERERFEEFEKIFGIDLLKQILNSSQELAREYKRRLGEYNKQEIIEKIDNMKREIDELKKKNKERENEKLILEQKRGEMKQKRKIFSSAKNLYEKLKKIENSERELKEIESYLENPENKKRYEIYEKYKNLYKDALSAKNASEEIIKLEEKLKMLENYKDKYEKYKEYLEYSNRDDVKELERIIKRGKDIKDEIMNFFKQEDIKKIKELLEQVSKEREDLLKQKDQIVKRLGEIENEIKQNLKVLREIENIKSICPICKRELDQNHKSKIQKEAKDEIERIKKERDKLNLELKKIEDKLRNIENILSEKMKVDEYYNLVKKFENFRALWEKWKEVKLYSKYEEEYKKYSSVIAIKESLEEKKKIIETWKEKYDFDYEEVIKYVDNEDNRIFFMDYEIKEQKARILKDEISKREEIQNELDRLKSHIGDIIFEQIDSIISNLDNEIEEISMQIGRIESEIKKNIEILSEIEKQIEEKRNELERILNLENKYKYFHDLCQKLEDTVACKRLAYSRNLNILVKYYFDKFALNTYKDIQILFENNGLIIKAIQENGLEVEARYLSGGEKTSLSLSIRLAISQLLDIKFKLLILDEPTDGMDNIRVESLRELFLNFIQNNPEYQIILITHEEEISDIPNAHRIHVIKGWNGSSVEIYTL